MKTVSILHEVLALPPPTPAFPTSVWDPWPRSVEEVVAVTHLSPPPPECACRRAGWRLDERPPPDWWPGLFAQRMSGCKADGWCTTTSWMFFFFFYCSPAGILFSMETIITTLSQQVTRRKTSSWCILFDETSWISTFTLNPRKHVVRFVMIGDVVFISNMDVSSRRVFEQTLFLLRVILR